MPELTPSFVFELERRMRTITESEYVRRMNAKHIWWNKVCRSHTMMGRTERLSWLLETAMIEPVGPSGTGKIEFQNLAVHTTELTSYRHAKGIMIQRDQLEDIDGQGVQEAQGWSKQVGEEVAYYPQRLAAQCLLNGANTDGTANAYDGVPFFADNTDTSSTFGLASGTVKGHPFNPKAPELGGYQNWLKGSSSGAYPGALDISDAVSVDQALQNLNKAIAHVKANKMPNGVDPRFLDVAYILCPPKMYARVAMLMKAKYIAMQAGSSPTGAGSADVEAYIATWGLGEPVEAQEIQAGQTYTAEMPFVATGGGVRVKTESLTGSDTTWYIVTQQATQTQLGSLLFMNRKPFKITYYSGDAGSGLGQDGVSQAQLDRMNQLEYHVQGRMAMQYGHPYGIYRIDAS